MNKKDARTSVPELPEDVRGLINKEVESGLSRLRAGDFEATLRAKMQAKAQDDDRASYSSVRARRPRKPFFLRWAPAFGLALVAAIIGIVALTTKSGPEPDPAFLASTLETWPGIRSLNLPAPDLSRVPVAPEAPSPLLGPLAAAAAQAEADAAFPVRPLPDLIPRYTLEQKIEILTKERLIERALTLIKSTSGEV